MDSYTLALRQAADQHGMRPTTTPVWLKDANAATSPQNSNPESIIEQSILGTHRVPPRPPPKSSLRSRTSFTQLERVVEETASQRSSTGSPSMSNSASSVISTSDSVRTAIYSPRDDGTEHATSSSSSSGKASTSSGAHTTPTSIGSRGCPGEDCSFVPTTSLTGSERRLPHAQGRGKAIDHRPTGASDASPVSIDNSTSTAAERRMPQGETAPAPTVPREAESEEIQGQDKVTSHLKSAAHTLANKLRPGRSNQSAAGSQVRDNDKMQHHQPMTEAIDGMIAELEPPNQEMRMTPRDAALSMYCYNARTPSPPLSRQNKEQSDRPGLNTYETLRDGVPILMKQKSGVWVEAVDGAELTSAQDQQQNVPKDQPLAEREAEDVPEIEIPDDPWNNLPPYIKLEYGTAQSSRPLSQRPDTRSRREQTTASWAQDQASMQQQRSPRSKPRPGSASYGLRASVVTPWDTQHLPSSRPRRRTMDSDTSLAPFYYEKGRIRQNSSHPSNGDQAGRSSHSSKTKSSSEKPSDSNSSPNTSLTTDSMDSPPPRAPRRIAPNQLPETDIQERIARSASAVEQLIYGLPVPRNHGRPSRFEDL